MIYQQDPNLEQADIAGQSSLKVVAGMLHRTGTEKLSGKQLKQRIEVKLRKEDEASKAK